jgi:hypothetical protein
MTSILNFESNVYSEELYSVSEQEFDEVMQASAVDNDWLGYSEWSDELDRASIVNTPHGEILIKKECAHSTCRTTRCEKAERFGGIAI